ncbi:MAG: T9SS type A sorting domain-containing protein [Flavobacteriales bacterium]|nr:T9SS type A sorting domain-containing protein [Flavobacteriales bacterium]
MFSVTCGLGQNLVPNGGFEEYHGCPDATGQIDTAMYWFNPTIGGENGSPDYFNECSSFYGTQVPQNFYGYQEAYEGSAYAGILLYYFAPANSREYIEVPLNSALEANSQYHFEMRANLSNSSRYTTDDIQVHFAEEAITDFPTYDPLPYVPQIINAEGNVLDSANWVLIEGDFIAEGGETHMVIGNFNDDANTSTSIVHSSGATFAYCYVDDVSLELVTGIEESSPLEGHIYPNPFLDQLTIEYVPGEELEFTIFDQKGREVLLRRIIGGTTIHIDGLSSGIYGYQVMTMSGKMKTGLLFRSTE